MKKKFDMKKEHEVTRTYGVGYFVELAIYTKKQGGQMIGLSTGMYVDNEGTKQYRKGMMIDIDNIAFMKEALEELELYVE